MRAWVLAAGAVALPLTIIAASGAAQTGTAASGWWYVGRSGQAPARQLVFVDRSTMRRSGDEASTRAMQVFEQPRQNIRAFAITYAFQCSARRIQSRDVRFTTIANREEPENGVIDDWSAVAPGSVAALLLDASCSGRFASEARRIVGAPLAEAQAIFRSSMTTTQATPALSATSLNSRPVPRLADCHAMPEPEASHCVLAVGEAELARLDAALPRRQLQCSGNVHSEGQVAGRFSASLSFLNRQGVVSFRPDPYGLSGRYPIRLADGAFELTLPNNIVARLYGRATQFSVRFTYSWDEEDLDPNNPFGTYRVSAGIQYLGDCS